MLNIVDHCRPIIPATDSKAISKRELIFGLTLGDKSMNLRNMIVFIIRSLHRASRLRLVTLNKSLTMIMTSFLCVINVI